MSGDPRLDWWTEARLGLFIHWGLYALPARHEWARSREKMSDEAYAQLLHDASEIAFSEKPFSSGFFPGHRPDEPAGTVTMTLPVAQPAVEVPVIEIFLR